MMASGHSILQLLAIVIGLLCHALVYVAQPAMMAEMFPTRLRYTGLSLGLQVTSIVAGSLASTIAVALLDRFDSVIPIACYLAVSRCRHRGRRVVRSGTNGVSCNLLMPPTPSRRTRGSPRTSARRPPRSLLPPDAEHELPGPAGL